MGFNCDSVNREKEGGGEIGREREKRGRKRGTERKRERHGGAEKGRQTEGRGERQRIIMGEGGRVGERKRGKAETETSVHTCTNRTVEYAVTAPTTNQPTVHGSVDLILQSWVIPLGHLTVRWSAYCNINTINLDMINHNGTTLRWILPRVKTWWRDDVSSFSSTSIKFSYETNQWQQWFNRMKEKKTHHFYCREISADQPWNVVGSEVSSGDPTNRGVTGRVYIYIYMRCKIADYTILYMGFGLTAKTFSVLLKKRRNLKSPSSSFFCAAVVSASQYKSTTNITKLTFADFFFFFTFSICAVSGFSTSDLWLSVELKWMALFVNEDQRNLTLIWKFCGWMGYGELSYVAIYRIFVECQDLQMWMPLNAYR